VSERVALCLLDAFALTSDDRRVALPMSAQRLVAFLALRVRPTLRVYVAGTLWPDATEPRAFANLRSTLWRLQRSGPRVVEARQHELQLSPDVSVDVREASALATRLLNGASDQEALAIDPQRLSGELLPDWFDDWVLMERERHRQLSLHALEALAEKLIAVAQHGRAIGVALAAVANEPLRESAHRILIRAHLAEGNVGEAVRQYRLYRRLLRRQLGLDPSPQMEALVRGLSRR
jgi:DNA-binding SARP family transcriptional activator